MNKSARVIQFHKTGGPEVLQAEEMLVAGPREKEVLVRVGALGLSRIDALWRGGLYFEEPALPSGIGYGSAGVVEAIGPKVTAVKVGDHVATLPAVSLLDYTAHGEIIRYPEDALFLYPRTLNFNQAAAVSIGLPAAYFALVELSDLQVDQYVVITAASASMGVAAIQVARKLGAKSIAVTRSELKEKPLIALGADHVIVAGFSDVQEAILDITAGEGAEVIYDGVAGPGLGELLWATRKFGHVIVYGCLGAMQEVTPVPLGACFLRGLSLHPSYRVFDFTGHPGLGIPPNREALERAKRFVYDGLAEEVLKPKIDRIFVGIEQYAAAHEYLGTNAQTGTIIVSLES
jgi:NADPH:quinone reductase-like Zn-dependent oxidoreductase